MKIFLKSFLVTFSGAFFMILHSCGNLHENSHEDKETSYSSSPTRTKKVKDTAKKSKLGRITSGAQCSKILSMANPEPLKSISDLETRFLRSHNEIRKIYGLPNLQWDTNIAAYAQAWADELKNKYQCALNHRQTLGKTEGKRFGENLASYSINKTPPDHFVSSPEFASLGWAKECKDWSYTKNSCAAGKQCGHFTQLIWKKSIKVGCGVAICQSKQSGPTEVWVCNYYPQGNIIFNRVKQRPF